MGESLSYNGLKILIPGQWINDGIINCTIKRFLDEAETPDCIKIVDTLFFNLIPWDQKAKKIVDYNVGQRFFKNIDIFKLEHLIFPINTEDHWFVIFVIRPNMIIEWDRNGDTNFRIKAYCSLGLRNQDTVEKIAAII